MEDGLKSNVHSAFSILLSKLQAYHPLMLALFLPSSIFNLPSSFSFSFTLASLNALVTQLTAWANSLQRPLEPLIRLVLAAFLGGLVGLEREIRGRQAGFRTNLLVSLGCALIMIVSISFA